MGARENIFEIIRVAAMDNNSCILCASADHEQLASICDRVIIFDRGRVIANLAQEVTKQAISQRCFGIDPKFHLKRRRLYTNEAVDQRNEWQAAIVRG